MTCLWQLEMTLNFLEQLSASDYTEKHQVLWTIIIVVIALQVIFKGK